MLDMSSKLSSLAVGEYTTRVVINQYDTCIIPDYCESPFTSATIPLCIPVL